MIPNSDPLRRLHTPLVPEIKTEIGASLKAARMKKGQSIDAVSQQTRISKKFLTALEENRFEEFPALAYLRGFLKSYCDYLDLDFEAFWKAIQAEAPQTAAPQPASQASGAVPAAPSALQRPGPGRAAAAQPPQIVPKPSAAPKTPAPKPSAPHRAVPAAPTAHHGPGPTHSETSSDSMVPGLVLLGVIAAAVVTLWLGHRSPAPKPELRAESTPAALQPAHPQTEPHLAVEFRQDAWISVTAEGKTLFEGRVPRNAKQDWTGKALTVKTPTPDALKLTLNGTSYALPAPDASGVYRIESP